MGNNGTNFELLVPTQKKTYSEVLKHGLLKSVGYLQVPKAPIVSIALMEIQPTEVLAYIFQQLFRLEDIVKCFNACERWKQIIGVLFMDKGQNSIK